MTRKEKIISFAWQHLLLFVALYIMTLGIAACVKSMLGASVISVLPYVFHNAGTLTRSNCSSCSWVLYSAC